MNAATLIGFALAFFVFAASPGPDNFTIFSKTITQGPRAGIAYGLGTVTGIMVFLSLGIAGLSYAAETLAPFMSIIRKIGALYLIWMGIALWRSAPEPATEQRPLSAPGRRSLAGTYMTGFALNLGNPKMPLFYLAILPNVAHADVGLAGFTLLVIVVSLVEAIVIGTYCGLALKTRAVATKPAVLRWLNRSAGALMAGAGVTILSKR